MDRELLAEPRTAKQKGASYADVASSIPQTAYQPREAVTNILTTNAFGSPSVLVDGTGASPHRASRREIDRGPRSRSASRSAQAPQTNPIVLAP